MELRQVAAALAFVVGLTGCSAGAGRPDAAAPTPAGDLTLWLSDPDEPYPFTTPIPPRAPTPVDGTYSRDYRQGSEPPPCIRCAPYRLDRGPATIDLHDGRYHLEQPGSRFRARGHYVVKGDRFILFNDPDCPDTRGVYRWSLGGGRLTLQPLDDPCPYDRLRSRYLSAMPWTAVEG